MLPLASLVSVVGAATDQNTDCARNGKTCGGGGYETLTLREQPPPGSSP